MDKELFAAGVIMVCVGLFFAVLGSGYKIVVDGLVYNILFSFRPFWSPPQVPHAHISVNYLVNYVGVAVTLAGVGFAIRGASLKSEP